MQGPRHTGMLDRDYALRRQIAVGALSCAVIVAVLVAEGSPADANDGLLLDLQETELFRSVQRGLDRHPNVMLAAAAALAVPMVALLAALSRAAARWRQPLDAQLGDHPNHRAAWIEIAGRRTPPVAVGEMVRIGDSDDCDLAIAGPSPGGTCALIQRTPDCEFILFDVSAGAAHLAVNGALSIKCRLNDGDRIEIGNACLVFRMGEAVPKRLRTRDA